MEPGGGAHESPARGTTLACCCQALLSLSLAQPLQGVSGGATALLVSLLSLTLWLDPTSVGFTVPDRNI